ncbi:MAG: hypothetical protein U5K99_01795 [Anaerolineales bacterium]|nr:hypothetical protein [Anaerolineales bacterium]
MTKNRLKPQVTIVSTKNCRRSKKVLEFLIDRGISHQHVELDSNQGQKLWEHHQFRASPGILVDGANINPYDVLDQEHCRVDEDQALAVFKAGHK